MDAMSDSSLQLCYELGYHSEIEGLPCRGSAKLLLDNLKDFAGENSELKDPNIMAMEYLHMPPYGLRHFPSVGSKANVEDALLWHRAADKMKITQLITQLFKQIVNHQVNGTQVIDLEDYDMGQFDEPNFPQSTSAAPDSPENDHGQTLDDSLPIEVQAMGPMTRLAIRDPTMLSRLLQAGFNEPLPLVASSERHLIGIVTAWMATHPGEGPPGSVGLLQRYCGVKYRYGRELTFATTKDYVWVERFKISDSYMGWILKESDGTCTMVKACHGNTGHYRGYNSWLGGDLGFTSKAIADTLGSARSMSFGGDGVGVGNVQEKPTTAASENVSSTAVAIKEEPSRATARQGAIQRKKIERQTDEQRWRFETPPISSLETVKKTHWPPQYVSPPATPQRQNTRLSFTPKEQKTSSTPKSQAYPRQRSSSPEFVSAGPARTPPGTRHSSRILKQSMSTFKAPITSKIKKPRKKGGRSLETIKKSQQKKAPESTTQSSPVPIKARTEAYRSESAATMNIIVHFFLSDETLGAIPVPLEQCNSVDTFFTQAMSAWRFLGNPDGSDSMAGIRVIMEGVQWPTIVSWGAADAFGRMMDAIAKARIGKMDDLHVQVKCIAK